MTVHTLVVASIGIVLGLTLDPFGKALALTILLTVGYLALVTFLAKLLDGHEHQCDGWVMGDRLPDDQAPEGGMSWQLLRCQHNKPCPIHDTQHMRGHRP